MADEAFALSPISARASLPSEQDYEAIREAFMETSRGRWFLGEYAKRNRNADTRMVLDAVERIEQTLAAQRQPLPPPDNGLAEALASIRGALDQARAAASQAIEAPALEPHLTPVRKSIRVIREISWRLREIGADGRICDLIDSQASAIEGACGQIASTDSRGALGVAFDLIERRIGEFEKPNEPASAPRPVAEAAPPPAPALPHQAWSDEMPAAVTVEPQTARAPVDVEVVIRTPARPAETVVTPSEVADVTVEVVDVTAEATEAATKATEAAEAYDEAVLDLVALEMAAPDPADADELPESATAEIRAVEPPRTDPSNADSKGADPKGAPVNPAAKASAARPARPQPPSQLSPKPSAQPKLEAAPESPRELPAESRPKPPLDASSGTSLGTSLGSTILAKGIVQKPRPSASDPLMAIRRMSQVEKIALFS